ncbi:MAG: MATE family efflux transporter, partial [Nannocystaceae bacterium]
IGAGTAVAEWISLGVGLWWVRDGLVQTAKLGDKSRLWALFAANRDILIRTMALAFSFAWFVNSGAKVGTSALAGNEVLLQFVAVSAFVLDAFAFVAEKEIGEAVGMQSRARLRRAMGVTTRLSLGFGAAIAGIYWLAGGPIIDVFIRDPQAHAVAREFLPYVALVPLIGVPAWMFDGAFLGATQGRGFRNAAVISAVGYVLADLWLAPQYGNTGVWAAFLWMYVIRGLALGWYWPELVRSVGEPPGASR